MRLSFKGCSGMCLTNDDIRRPTAALGYGRCRGGMESLSFMTKRMSSNDYRSDKKKASESWRPCVISSKSFGTDTYAKA